MGVSFSTVVCRYWAIANGMNWLHLLTSDYNTYTGLSLAAQFGLLLVFPPYTVQLVRPAASNYANLRPRGATVGFLKKMLIPLLHEYRGAKIYTKNEKTRIYYKDKKRRK